MLGLAQLSFATTNRPVACHAPPSLALLPNRKHWPAFTLGGCRPPDPPLNSFLIPPFFAPCSLLLAPRFLLLASPTCTHWSPSRPPPAAAASECVVIHGAATTTPIRSDIGVLFLFLCSFSFLSSPFVLFLSLSLPFVSFPFLFLSLLSFPSRSFPFLSFPFRPFPFFSFPAGGGGGGGLGHLGAWAFLPLQFWREVFSTSLGLNSFWVVHHCCGGWPVVIQPKYAKHARPPLAEGQRYQIIFSSSAAPSWIGVGAGVWVVCKYVGDGIP